jgi:hypothetical protein
MLCVYLSFTYLPGNLALCVAVLNLRTDEWRKCNIKNSFRSSQLYSLVEVKDVESRHLPSIFKKFRAPGGGKSRKRTAADGRPRALGNAGGAAGSVHGLSLRVDTLSTLSPMRSVK